jgi:hypothetical protein
MRRIAPYIPEDQSLETWLGSKVQQKADLEAGCTQIVVYLPGGAFVETLG